MENTFIQFAEIKGEAREKGHKDWVPVRSLDWGLERTVNMTDLGTSQRGYANANFSKITCSAAMSKASFKLCQYVASGKTDPKVTIHFCRSGDDPSIGMEPYLIFSLTDCMIDSYFVTGGEDLVPQETFTLAYRKIEFEYKAADFKTGKLSTAGTFVWNLESGDVS